MRLLIDSHTLIWAVDDPSRLAPRRPWLCRTPPNELLLSAATIWEIAIKVSLGKLTLSLSYRDWMNQAITALGLAILPVTVDYADNQVVLPWHHRDPFDRLLIAQALTDGIAVVSADPQFDAYGITRVW